MSKQEATTHASPSVHFPSMQIDEVLKTLSVDPERGLSHNEVKSRLERYGPNTIPKAKGSFWKVYLAPILNWLITIYLISSFALLIIAWLVPSTDNRIGQAMLWLSVVIVNCLVAIFQQFRAQKKLEALEKLSAGESRVVREGSDVQVDPVEIVPGDIIKLEQGDRIPADARILVSTNFATNEASLTGESVPVAKHADAVVSPDAPLTDMRNMVFLGTYVATGVARAVVTTTGRDTEIGKIQGSLESLNTGDIPLRKKVNLLAKYLGIAAIILLFVSISWRIFVTPIIEQFPISFAVDIIAAHVTEGITRAMTIMPINIPLLTTIVLLTGVLAMAKHGVIIRDLSAVESLGRVSVICSDKTGTMTRNQMTVKYCWDTENLYAVTGDGYEPRGEIYRVRNPDMPDRYNSEDKVLVSDVYGWKGLYTLIVCGGINNDSEIIQRPVSKDETVWTPVGDPTDAALLALFRKSGLDEAQIRKQYEIVLEFPFESELKRMSKVCRNNGNYTIFTKGATEVLLPLCRSVHSPSGPKPLTPAEHDRINRLAQGFAEQGYRVISLAYREATSLPTGSDARSATERDLIYVGFTCIVDPPRDGVREAVDACHSAGIDVVMITGDAAATARTIAKDLNIMGPDSLVVEGNQIADLSDAEFARVNVFARVNPEHKQVIVERYQAQGKVVSMTGDGVNDALALAMSDAGVAMGITGTDVAKEAADLIITDDSFASIVTGVKEGRGLFTKIRMMVYFYIAINLFESIIFFGAMFFLPSTVQMLAPWQSLYLIVTTHSFPGLALVFDKTSPHVMDEEPRDSEEIITGPLARYMILNVILMAFGAAMAYFLTYTGWLGIVDIYPENGTGFYSIVNRPMKATVMMLTVLLLLESTIVLIIRRINMPLSKSLREPGTYRFAILLGLIYIAHLGLMYLYPAQEILDSVGLRFFFVPLTWYDWLICILLALPAIVGMELYKRMLRRNNVTL
ncbi:MAG: cation-transporting P-type ATPase [Candidatus Thorarchaeota archaeon]|nr:cation-transporting P-type ATPase [Candidatus Thorarchaeota archaeon]